MAAITSLQNERVKLVRALQSQGKTRRKEGRIVLEGVRLIGDAFAVGIRPEFVLYTPDVFQKTGAPLLHDLIDEGVNLIEVSEAVMAHAADTQTPQGMLAVIPTPTIPIPQTLTFILILDAVADPGNLGTILRTAGASGVDVVVLAPDCVDPFNPKVLRGGMGAHFRVPVVQKSWHEIKSDYAHLPFYLADADGQIDYFSVDWTTPAGLIIGGEARGADDQARTFARQIISIPMANKAESLNAGIAAGVILFEARRQRILKSTK